MNMFTQEEIILMIGVVSVLLVCITILTILDIREYLKDKKKIIHEDVSFGEEYEEEKSVVPNVLVEETKEYDTEGEILVSDIKEDVTSDDIFLEEMEDEKFDTTVVNVNQEVVMPKAFIEETIKKEKKRLPELDEIEANLPNNKDDVTNFEMEQERTAIISLDELMKKSNELYDNNEIVQYDDGDEPISIDEVIAKFNKENGIVKEAMVEEKSVPVEMRDIVEEKELYSKKETIPFISSVYGIETKDNALEFENTATYEKLDRQHYNDFVTKLREMNENK